MSSEVTANRKRLEASIVALSKKRDAIDAELRVLMSMLKASGPLDRRKTRARDGWSEKTPAKHALELLAGNGKRGVTAADLAKRSGQSRSNAAATLAYLAGTKVARRVRRGVYVAGKGGRGSACESD